MNQYEAALDSIIKLDRALRKVGKKFPYLRGLAGEFLVMEKLEEKGFEILPKSIASKYDIELVNCPRKRVEVKTSTIKQCWGIDGYGWTVLKKRQKPGFDYLICVGIEGLKNCRETAEFYVLDIKEIKPFLLTEEDDEQDLGWVTSVSEALHICRFVSDWPKVKDVKDQRYTKLENRVNGNIKEYYNKWDKIRKQNSVE